MSILGPKTADVLQEDELFRSGGILTVGMSPGGALNENGITWSLPLSHLRFYGKPITKTRSLGLDSERVYFDDLKYLVLGAVTGNWFTKSGGLHRVVDFLDALVSCLRAQTPQDPRNNTSAWLYPEMQSKEDVRRAVPMWLEILWRAASDIRASQGQLRSDQERLYKLGHRRGLKFLSASGLQIPEAFGLTNFDTFIAQFADHEEKIKKVRKLLPTLISDSSLLQDGFISYRYQNEPSIKTQGESVRGDAHMHSTHADFGLVGFQYMEEFATIIPRPSHPGLDQRRIPSNHVQGSLDKISTQKGLEYSLPVTWEVPYMISPNSGQVKRCTALSESTGEVCGLYIHEAHNLRRGKIFSDTSSLGSTTREMEPPFSTLPPEILQTSNPDWAKRIEAAHTARALKAPDPSQQEAVHPLVSISGIGSDGSVTLTTPSRPAGRQAKPSWMPLRKATTGPTDVKNRSEPATTSPPAAGRVVVPFCLRLRDVADKGVISSTEAGCPQKYYISVSAEEIQTCRYSLFAGDGDRFGVWLPANSMCQLQGVPLDEFITTSEQCAQREVLIAQLANFWGTGHQEHLASLQAFVYASKIFENLPGATIALSVMKQPLHRAKWCSQHSDNFALGKAFSCLAMFETGSVDIEPIELKDIMAMSAGNSLFMAEYIFNDPSETSENVLVRRTIGNIGKPGISFLVSAQALDTLSPDYSSWKSSQYAAYDGSIEDNFAQTTLHLTFTGDEQPLNIGQTGLRDKEVFLIEAVIRAYDKSRWVADLDLKLPLKDATAQQFLRRLGKCNHSEQERGDYSAFEPLTSIDSWDELLDPPPNACIVRAKANWLARQAIVAFALQQLKPLVVASDRVCWACVASGIANPSNLLVIS